MLREVRPLVQETLHPWSHCCCQVWDISQGFKVRCLGACAARVSCFFFRAAFPPSLMPCAEGQVLCVVLLVWAVLQVATACVGLASKSSVWESELEFNTHGLSVFQLLTHLYLVRARGTEIVANCRVADLVCLALMRRAHACCRQRWLASGLWRMSRRMHTRLKFL